MPVRKMPQNIEAEMSVLGVAFLQKNALGLNTLVVSYMLELTPIL